MHYPFSLTNTKQLKFGSSAPNLKVAFLNRIYFGVTKISIIIFTLSMIVNKLLDDSVRNKFFFF